MVIGYVRFGTGAIAFPFYEAMNTFRVKRKMVQLLCFMPLYDIVRLYDYVRLYVIRGTQYTTIHWFEFRA